MATLNKVTLIGNLTADTELKQTTSGVSVCSFTIAVNRRFAKEGDPQTADFIPVVTWRKDAEFVAKHFKKGTPILICGELQSRSWTDAQGQKKYTLEVVADEVGFVEAKRDGAAPATAAQGGELPY
ncbi:MAG: single-stranded DNA-binding protein [Clostridia bacterium]|nr:single-stranded DNA-binding protein [Clostridia bacterium]